MVSEIKKEIESHKNLEKGKFLSGFFKTGKGQYGEGDIFWGLTVPISRSIALKYKKATLSDIRVLLKDKVHEVRLVGILILVWKYEHASTKEQKEIVVFYLKNIKYINNWDLVDLSAPRILGEYLFTNGDKNILLKLAKSKNLWEQRISIISTFSFIKHGDFDWTLKISKMLFSHEHDLIHKAVGWMLREVGKKNEKLLRKFLDINLRKIPRTTLRYSIERFREDIRLKYLRK